MGLPGEKPIMPRPPKVCPLEPVLPLAPVLLAPLLALEELVAPAVEPAEASALPASLSDPKNELLPVDDAPATPFPPLGPVPAIVEPASG